jgi:hypothetical protein
MSLQFTYEFHRSLHENIERYASNRDYWDTEDTILHDALAMTGGRVGPERKKWKYFTDNIKPKIINMRHVL